MKDNFKVRVNFQIRVPNVRVVQDGNQLGIMPTDKARNLAYDSGMDLVEMVPNANPPVCHIMDFGKYKYEQKIKQKEAIKKQREALQEVKELRFSPAIDSHDLQTKCKHIREFLEDDKKVQIVMKFRSREMVNKDVGLQKFSQIIEFCKEQGETEIAPRFDGNKFICRLTPLKKKKPN